MLAMVVVGVVVVVVMTAVVVAPIITMSVEKVKEHKTLYLGL